METTARCDSVTYIGPLGGILIASLGSSADVIQTQLIVLALSMLTEECHHTQSLLHCSSA
jgi:hypothetical protein